MSIENAELKKLSKLSNKKLFVVNRMNCQKLELQNNARLLLVY